MEPGPSTDAPDASVMLHADDRSSKRSASNDDSEQPTKVARRRAARACASCRARKVRCDVVEGAPCGNCRWDNVECVVQESRRRKKHHHAAAQSAGSRPVAEAQELRCKTATDAPAPVAAPAALGSADAGTSLASPSIPFRSVIDPRRPGSGSGLSTSSNDAPADLPSKHGHDSHMPHMLYQRPGYARGPLPLSKQLAPASSASGKALSSAWAGMDHATLLGEGRQPVFFSPAEDFDAGASLPGFLRPLPRRIDNDDARYLQTKGALAVPAVSLQNALLRAFVECVHPYMPLIDLHEFLNVVHRRDGLNGQISLLLFQAVMFASVAFVDMKYLREAGYPTRKAARRAFFQKTRLLYDFDYESDRLVLVQALLLMTYWYDTPDDQKDTWHWMGVAISLAHTIGLHRNPDSTSMSPSKQKLWKRIWWSCFMRDRLIALGMRRPTRIKDEDFDVPMLSEDDFQIEALSSHISIIPNECTLARDLDMQRELAAMCIAKAKLCVCVSHMLRAQYSVLIRDNMKPENTTNSTMMLFPNKNLDNVESVHAVDSELRAWAESLPGCCRYRSLMPQDVQGGRSTVAVQRTLLHMVYYTTVSALHRPQFLPSSPLHPPTTSRQVQEVSRARVRDAAAQITRMATELHDLRLERYLPTTGVTVILPAMIIHLLEMKSPSPQGRECATRGFRECMRVMEKLREVYAAADYATGFLDAALKKAAIDINARVGESTMAMMKRVPVEFSAQTPPPENIPYMTASESFFNENSSTPLPPPPPSPSPPNTVHGAALDLSAGRGSGCSMGSRTDLGDSAGAAMTPSASGGSEEVEATQAGTDAMNLDFMQGHDEFDWNAVAGTDFDVDQWLQFPAEGVTGLDDGLVGAGQQGHGVVAADPPLQVAMGDNADRLEAPAMSMDGQQQ